MASTTTRFYFDSIEAAAAGLLTVLLDARTTEHSYSITGLDATSVFTSGLILTGEIAEVVAKVEDIPGADRQDE
jgi:hypothetical protein